MRPSPPVSSCTSTTTPAPTSPGRSRRVASTSSWRRSSTAAVIVAPGGAEGLADLAAVASRRVADIEALDPGVRRLVRPHTYHVSITDRLFTLKQDLLQGMSRF